MGIGSFIKKGVNKAKKTFTKKKKTAKQKVKNRISADKNDILNNPSKYLTKLIETDIEEYTPTQTYEWYRTDIIKQIKNNIPSIIQHYKTISRKELESVFIGFPCEGATELNKDDLEQFKTQLSTDIYETITGFKAYTDDYEADHEEETHHTSKLSQKLKNYTNTANKKINNAWNKWKNKAQTQPSKPNPGKSTDTSNNDDVTTIYERLEERIPEIKYYKNKINNLVENGKSHITGYKNRKNIAAYTTLAIALAAGITWYTLKPSEKQARTIPNHHPNHKSKRKLQA